MQKKVYFQNLDAIRFILALMVFLSHQMDQLFVLSNCKWIFLGRIWNLIARGNLRVSMFFILSGFLITYILLKEKELTDHINVKNFYIRRILRIWPLYFLILLISFGIIPVALHLTEIINTIPVRLPYYIAFLSNFDLLHLDKFHFGPANSMALYIQFLTWSVSVEEQFYLVWPLLLLFIKPRYYIFIFIFTIIASIAFRLYYRIDDFILGYHTFSVAVYLAIGGLSAYLILKYRSFQNLFSRIPPWVSGLIYISGSVGLLYRLEIMKISPYGMALMPLFYGSFFAFILLDQNFSPQSFLKLGRFKFLSYWGKYSYGIYLLHPVAMGIVALCIAHLNIMEANFFNYLITGLVTLALTMAMSYVSYEFYEKRFLAMKKKFSVIVRD